MLYCTSCDQFFEEEEAVTSKECVGECWGIDAYRIYSACPHCGSDQIEEAHRCKLCGEWKADDLYDYCEPCRDKVYDMYCLMLLTLETDNPGATRDDVLELMGEKFEDFWTQKL